MSTDIKHIKAQISEIIQSGGYLARVISNLGKFSKSLGKEALTKVAVPFAKDVFSELNGAVRAEKGFTLFISNEDMDGIIKMVESLEKLGLLIDSATVAVRNDMKKQKGGILGVRMAAITGSLIAFIVSSFIKLVASSTLMMNVLGKGGQTASVTLGRFSKTERICNN